MIKPQAIPIRGAEASAAALSGRALEALIPWINRQLTCSHCGRCTLRCEVLREPDLDIGEVDAAYQRLMRLPDEERPAALIELVQERFDLYHALRRCCFCGYCTATCAHHVLGVDKMRQWRELFSQARLMPPQDSRLVMVDEEWNLFSAYRAIYGIGYGEFLSLEDAAAAGSGLADTLLFPGCSLASYAPELLRAVGAWMNGRGLRWALSVECCGSPLMSAGLFERAQGLRERIVEAMRAAGITRMVTVCPGCGEEFAEMLAGEIEIVPLPELIERETADAADAEAAGLAPATFGRASATVFDSCHDRAEGRHGRAIRALLGRFVPELDQRSMPNRAGVTLCCGAGGAVASYDEDITHRRVWTVIDEAARTGADDVVTMCPTCAYTIAEALLSVAEPPISTHHYLEYLFGIEIDWAEVFAALGAMWTGEYGPWLNETFFS